MRISEVGKAEEECEEKKAAMAVKMAMVGAGSRILFYPTLLYNIIRNRIEPAGFRWWDRVDQHVLLGAVPFPSDVPHLRQLGVRGVVTLNEPYETLVPSSLYMEHGINHLVISTRDYLFAPSPDAICRAVDFIHMNALLGRTTYVHCKAGRGRSTTIVLCYLVKHKNMTPEAALEYVRLRRPRVLLASSQWKAVAAYSRSCNSGFISTEATKDLCSLQHNEASITPSDINDHSCDELNNQFLVLSFYQISHQMPGSPSGSHDDEVIVTDEDLEGYRTPEGGCRELGLCSGGVPSKPIMKKLCCLFSTLRLPGKCEPAAPNRLAEVRAC